MSKWIRTESYQRWAKDSSMMSKNANLSQAEHIAGRGSEVNGELVLGLGKMHCLLALQSKLLYLSKKHTFRAKSINAKN